MEVSIIIVSYNTSKFLDNCIASVKQETDYDFEIIVVDNASTDDSVHMVRKKYPDVRLLENSTNPGFSKANNQGFRIAKGKYIFLLNPDTIILDHAIDKLIDFMNKNPRAGICGPKNLNDDFSLQYNCDFFPSIWNIFCQYFRLDVWCPNCSIFNRTMMKYWDHNDIREVERIAGCSLLIRGDVYRKLGGLDEKYFLYFEETDFCFRAKQQGFVTMFYPKAVIIHYGGESAKKDNVNEIFTSVALNYYLPSKYYFFKNYIFPYAYCVRLLDILYAIILFLKNVFRKNKETKNQKLRKAGIILKYAVSKTM